MIIGTIRNNKYRWLTANMLLNTIRHYTNKELVHPDKNPWQMKAAQVDLYHKAMEVYVRSMILREEK